jgi:hypothetical protein
MSETMNTTKNSKKDATYVLRAFQPKNGKVKYYQKRALELSKMVNKNPPWSWRYVESVDHETIKPGTKFVKAVQLLKDQQEKPPMPEWQKKAKRNIARMAKTLRVSIKENGHDDQNC